MAYPGSTINIIATITDDDDSLINAESISFRVQKPNKTIVTFGSGEIVNTSTGTYQLAYEADASGEHTVSVATTHPNRVQYATFTVLRAPF